MADVIECDTFIGSKRRIAEIEEALLQQPSINTPLKEDSKDSRFLVLSSPTEDQKINQDIPSPSSLKKVRCSFNTIRNPVADFEDNGEKNTERAILDDTDAVRTSGDFTGKIGTFGVEEKETESGLSLEHNQGKVDDESLKDVNGETKKESAVVECKEFDDHKEAQMGCVLGENNELPTSEESLVKEKNKQLLAEVEDGSIFKEKAHVEDIHGCDGDAGILSLKRINDSVIGSWKIELIDDTALIGPVPLAEAGNSGVEVECDTRNGGQEGETSTKKGEGGSKALTMTQVSDAQTCGGEKVDGMKRRYSREEMEDLRFINIVEQRKLWRDIYTGLGNAVVNEYEDLGSSKHQKNVRFNGPQQHFRRSYNVPGILGAAVTRGPWDRLNVVVH